MPERNPQTAIAPTEPNSTTQRQPARPRGANGTTCQASNATTGTAVKQMHWLMEKERPRKPAGTSSTRYVSMVTSCTPKPTPAMNRQMLSPSPVRWNAMMTVEATYQSKDAVKTVLRPKRSAACAKAMTPTHNPAKVEKTNVPKPATFKALSEANTPSDSGVNRPLCSMPGATYAVKNRS